MAKTDRPIQIKSLPRTGERPPPALPERPSFQIKPNQVIVGVAAILTTAVFLWDDREPAYNTIPSHPQEERVLEGTPEARVNQFLNEAKMQQRMAMQSRELENKISSKPLGGGDMIIPDSKRPLGVTMDQEGAAEKVYQDIYGPENKNRAPQTPEERINMRIEEERWMSQLERQERKQYVETFLKEAYDAGYAIDLDENLVVVRVRKVTSRPSQTLDQVLENLSRKGY